MKLLPILIGCLILVGCAYNQEQLENEAWRKVEKKAGLPCRELSRKAISGQYYGACYYDFWRDYKECFGRAMTGTGCALVMGEEHLAKPECFPKNCPEQWPQRFPTLSDD